LKELKIFICQDIVWNFKSLFFENIFWQEEKLVY